MTSENECKINEFIDKVIQVVNQCKFLLLNIPVNKVSTFDEIESIDEAAEKLDR